jgi:hypothetical protein
MSDHQGTCEQLHKALLVVRDITRLRRSPAASKLAGRRECANRTPDLACRPTWHASIKLRTRPFAPPAGEAGGHRFATIVIRSLKFTPKVRGFGENGHRKRISALCRAMTSCARPHASIWFRNFWLTEVGGDRVFSEPTPSLSHLDQARAAPDSQNRAGLLTVAVAAAADGTFGNPDQPAEGAVNVTNPKALTDPGPEDPDLAANEPAFLNPPATDVNGMPQFWTSFNLAPKRRKQVVVNAYGSACIFGSYPRPLLPRILQRDLRSCIVVPVQLSLSRPVELALRPPPAPWVGLQAAP